MQYLFIFLHFGYIVLAVLVYKKCICNSKKHFISVTPFIYIIIIFFLNYYAFSTRIINLFVNFNRYLIEKLF